MKTETGKKVEKLVKLIDKLTGDFRENTGKIIEALNEIKQKEKGKDKEDEK